MRKVVVIEAYDYDGTLHSKSNGVCHDNIIQNNLAFIKRRAAAAKQAGATYIEILPGTNRQCADGDIFSSMGGAADLDAMVDRVKTTSCFYSYELLTAEYQRLYNGTKVNIQLEKQLLSDIYGEHDPGFQFDLAKTLSTDEEQLKYYISSDKDNVDERYTQLTYVVPDTSKVSIIYADAHAAAIRHAGAIKLILNLYDDEQGILGRLKQFYQANPGLLPDNLTLNLYHREYGGKEMLYCTLKGTGFIDNNYQNTLREHVRDGLKMCNTNLGKVDVGYKLNIATLRDARGLGALLPIVHKPPTTCYIQASASKTPLLAAHKKPVDSKDGCSSFCCLI